MKILFKILAFIFAVFFIWAAYVQYNDPDAMLWYIIYGSAVLFSLLFLFDKLRYYLAVFAFILYMAGVFIFWPKEFQGVEIGKGNINNIEHARESLGLLINAIVMMIYALRIRFIKKHS